LPEGVEFVYDLQYVEGGHERNRLDLYLPKNAKGRVPVIVWVSGGWVGGDKKWCEIVPFAASGYAVASIDCRLSKDAVFPAQIEDCKAAIRWLRASAAKYRLDADHIGVVGSSDGGHLAALLGTTAGVKELEGNGGNLGQSSRVQCVVDFRGPTDFVHWDPNFDKPFYAEITKLLGAPAQANPAKARAASPLYYVGRNSAPFVIFHEYGDELIPFSQSEELADALKKVGVESNLVAPKDLWGRIGAPENRQLMEEFFAKHLGKVDCKNQCGAGANRSK
jgi:acetyl esterase/lipase